MILDKRKKDNETAIVENTIQVPLQELDDKVAIMEATIMDLCPDSDSMESFLESTNCKTLLSMDLLNEKSIIKLDKTAKKKKAISVAVLKLAKRDNSIDFKKWLTVTKQKKFLFEKMYKKYKNAATKEANEMIKKVKR